MKTKYLYMCIVCVCDFIYIYTNWLKTINKPISHNIRPHHFNSLLVGTHTHIFIHIIKRSPIKYMCNNFTRNQKIPMPIQNILLFKIFFLIEPLSTDARKKLQPHKNSYNTYYFRYGYVYCILLLNYLEFFFALLSSSELAKWTRINISVNMRETFWKNTFSKKTCIFSRKKCEVSESLKAFQVNCLIWKYSVYAFSHYRFSVHVLLYF